MSKFKTHLKDGIEMLKKGQAVHSRMGRGVNKKVADRKAYTGWLITCNQSCRDWLSVHM